jgi:hypothetical protein
MWLAIVLLIRPALTSLPIPLPGIAVSLAMTVRLRAFPDARVHRPRARAVPTAMNPPIMRLAASGMRATASLSDIVFMVRFLTVRSRAATAGSGDQYLCNKATVFPLSF